MKTKARFSFALRPFGSKLGKPEYWDHFARLALEVPARNQATLERDLADSLRAVRETWAPETAAHTFDLVRNARKGCNQTVPWCTAIEKALLKTGGNGAERRLRGLKHQPVIQKRM
jgi:hypothetical protein